MILDISSENFRNIFKNKKFDLPIRWDNSDFLETLKELFESYQQEVKNILNFDKSLMMLRTNVDKVCKDLLEVVKRYLDGFPASAYNKFKYIMELLQKNPLKIYEKTAMEQFYNYNNDPLKLYRIACVNDNIPYNRSRVFHPPYYMRSKISSCRYSIAGYPSLYLGTSLELCEEETKYNPHEQYALASRFQLERYFDERNRNIEIKVIELAIKPQDFFECNYSFDNRRDDYQNMINMLKDPSVQNAYIVWYPLIASCSFIRVNKKDPFAAEYIIPQLLMQWVRKEMSNQNENYDKLIGIRYFSCASVKASNMGYNYVFPTSGIKNNSPFCPILSSAFKLTQPKYIHEYTNIQACEDDLLKDVNLDFI